MNISDHTLQHFLVNYMAGAAIELTPLKTANGAHYYFLEASGGDYLLLVGAGRKPALTELQRLDSTLPPVLKNFPAALFPVASQANARAIIQTL
jgi:hypothetical protein